MGICMGSSFLEIGRLSSPSNLTSTSVSLLYKIMAREKNLLIICDKKTTTLGLMPKLHHMPYLISYLIWEIGRMGNIGKL